MRAALLALVLTGLMAPTAVAQVPAPRTLQLAFQTDGSVSLSAQNVTVREILAEWARQCGCYVVNWDKLAGGPLAMPIQFDRAPQQKVLESLLRQAAGFVLTPKREGSRAISNYETIYILATSSAVAGGYVPPVVPPPSLVPMPTPGSPEEEIPAVNGQPGLRPDPPMPLGPAAPGMAPGNTAPRPANVPGVLVPIVPVMPAAPAGSSGQGPGRPVAPPPQTPGTATPPGTSTPPPPMPVPIVPAPSQVR